MAILISLKSIHHVLLPWPYLTSKVMYIIVSAPKCCAWCVSCWCRRSPTVRPPGRAGCCGWRRCASRRLVGLMGHERRLERERAGVSCGPVLKRAGLSLRPRQHLRKVDGSIDADLRPRATMMGSPERLAIGADKPPLFVRLG